MKAALYFESHVTIEPIFDELAHAHAGHIAAKYNFKIAKLLMQKRKEDTEERSKHDTFMTGHSNDYLDIVERTRGLVLELQKNRFKVWRYKVEDTLFDSRNDDYLGLGVAA